MNQMDVFNPAPGGTLMVEPKAQKSVPYRLPGGAQNTSRILRVLIVPKGYVIHVAVGRFKESSLQASPADIPIVDEGYLLIPSEIDGVALYPPGMYEGVRVYLTVGR